MAKGRRINADDVATATDARGEDYGKGPYDTSDANVTKIAGLLKTSKSEVRRAMREAAQERTDAMYKGLTGRNPPDETSPRSMLQEIFGAGPRGGAVNANAAAKALKVTANTVRRWAAGTQKPSPERMKKLKAAARRLTRTKAGRRTATDSHRRRRPTPPGGDHVWVTGWQGPEDRYSSERYRTVKMPITADQIDELLDKYEQEGEDGLHEWLTTHYQTSATGVADWQFRTIDKFGFGDPNYD
jgi:hypothetical protein